MFLLLMMFLIYILYYVNISSENEERSIRVLCLTLGCCDLKVDEDNKIVQAR